MSRPQSQLVTLFAGTAALLVAFWAADNGQRLPAGLRAAFELIDKKRPADAHGAKDRYADQLATSRRASRDSTTKAASDAHSLPTIWPFR